MLDAARRVGRAAAAAPRRCWRRSGQEDVALAAVGDQVVDDAAGLLVAAQRVLRLAVADPVEIVGEAAVDEARRAGAGARCLAQVADVEDARRRCGSRRAPRRSRRRTAASTSRRTPRTSRRARGAGRPAGPRSRSRQRFRRWRRSRVATLPGTSTGHYDSALMTRMTLTKTPLSELNVDALVIGVASNGYALVLAPGAADVDKALGKKLARRRLTGAGRDRQGRRDHQARHARRDQGDRWWSRSVSGAAPRRATGYDPEQVRRRLGAAIRSLAGTARSATALAAGQRRADRRRPASRSRGRAARRLRVHAATAHGRATGLTQVTGRGRVRSSSPRPGTRRAKTAVERANIVGDAVALVRDLVNTPAADLHPADLVAVAPSPACTEVGCDGRGPRREGARRRAATAASSASARAPRNPPRLVRIAWSGGRGREGTVHLVGKGITFDSGGLSLKPPTAMEWMKADMGGAAAVIATLQRRRPAQAADQRGRLGRERREHARRHARSGPPTS